MNEPHQHADDSITAHGPQAVVQITDGGLRWIVGMQCVVVALMLALGAAVGYAVSLSIMEREAYHDMGTEYRLHLQAVMRLEARVNAMENRDE